MSLLNVQDSALNFGTSLTDVWQTFIVSAMSNDQFFSRWRSTQWIYLHLQFFLPPMVLMHVYLPELCQHSELSAAVCTYSFSVRTVQTFWTVSSSLHIFIFTVRIS
jgi:hypothetical protein